MSNIPLSILFLLLFILILLSAFFSGSETALMTINRYRLSHLAKEGHPGAKRAERLLKRPDRLIGLILLGNNFVNILASSIATVIALRLGGENAIAFAAGILTLVILIFSEVSPKTLAALHPEKLAFPAAYIYIPLMKVSYPLVWVVNGIANALLKRLGVSPDDQNGHSLSQEELRTVVLEAGAIIPQKHRKMLLSILDLEKLNVEDIMIPRNEIDGIDLTEPMEETVNTIVNSQYTRLPVFDDSIDEIIGVLHMRKALRLMESGALTAGVLREICDPPYYVPEGTPLNQQLLNFQKTKNRMGLVVDEYGDILGLVTLVDLLEEIVGDFVSDPSDSTPDIVRQEDGSYLVSGTTNIKDLVRRLHWDLPTDGPRTINGLIIEYLETIPEPGTSLLLNDYPVEILQIQDNAVRTVRVKPKLRRV